MRVMNDLQAKKPQYVQYGLEAKKPNLDAKKPNLDAKKPQVSFQGGEDSFAGKTVSHQRSGIKSFMKMLGLGGMMTIATACGKGEGPVPEPEQKPTKNPLSLLEQAQNERTRIWGVGNPGATDKQTGISYIDGADYNSKINATIDNSLSDSTKAVYTGTRTTYLGDISDYKRIESKVPGNPKQTKIEEFVSFHRDGKYTSLTNPYILENNGTYVKRINTLNTGIMSELTKGTKPNQVKEVSNVATTYYNNFYTIFTNKQVMSKATSYAKNLLR